MSDQATARRILPPESRRSTSMPTTNREHDEDRLLHQITREAFAMNGDQRALALTLLRAVRGWASYNQ